MSTNNLLIEVKVYLTPTSFRITRYYAWRSEQSKGYWPTSSTWLQYCAPDLFWELGGTQTTVISCLSDVLDLPRANSILIIFVSKFKEHKMRPFKLIGCFGIRRDLL